MSSHRRLLALVTVGAATLSLAACVPSYEGVTPAEFAATACSNWATTVTLEEPLGEVVFEPIFDYEAGDRTDQRDRVLEVADEFLEHLRTASAELGAAVPAVKDGAEIAALFTDYYDERLALAEPLVDDFRSIPTVVESDEIIDAAQDLMFAIDYSSEFPFRDIEDEKIIEAIGEEPSCVGYVTITQFGF